MTLCCMKLCLQSSADVCSWEIEAFSNFSPVFKPTCINRHKNMYIELQGFFLVFQILAKGGAIHKVLLKENNC